MGYGIKLKVWGEYAAFNRPEMKVERVSYDVMTPSAARGVLEAIYWKPEMRWVVDRIHVLKPIQFTTVRRNEVSVKIPVRGANGVGTVMRNGRGTLGVIVDGDIRQQRASLLLKDVCYGIEAHIEVLEVGKETKPEAKHLDSFRRRAARGQYFHHPYLGNREFPAYFELVDAFPAAPPELQGERDLGFMLHDILYTERKDGNIIEAHAGRRLAAEARFFRAGLVDGVMNVPTIKETIG